MYLRWTPLQICIHSANKNSAMPIKAPHYCYWYEMQLITHCAYITNNLTCSIEVRAHVNPVNQFIIKGDGKDQIYILGEVGVILGHITGEDCILI